MKENEETKGTETFKTFATEEDFNKELKSASSKGKFELLKELGVEKIDDIKTQLSRVKEIEDAQKTDTQKLIEQLDASKNENTTLKNSVKDRDLNDAIKSELNGIGVDSKFASKIKRLLDTENIYDDKGLNQELLKEMVSKEATELNLVREQEESQSGFKIGNEAPNNTGTSTKENAFDIWKNLRKQGKL